MDYYYYYYIARVYEDGRIEFLDKIEPDTWTVDRKKAMEVDDNHAGRLAAKRDAIKWKVNNK